MAGTLRRRSRPERASVKADLLAAATAAFERDGYGGTSLDAVAAAAGYTKGAVYSNFGGKPELFAQACADRLAATSLDLLHRVTPVLEAGSGRESLLMPLADAVAAATMDTPLRWQILLSEFRLAALRDEALGGVYAELARVRAGRLVEQLASNAYLARLDESELRRAAVVLLNLVNALALEHAAAPETVDRDTIVDAVAAFLDVVLP